MPDTPIFADVLTTHALAWFAEDGPPADRLVSRLATNLVPNGWTDA